MADGGRSTGVVGLIEYNPLILNELPIAKITIKYNIKMAKSQTKKPPRKLVLRNGFFTIAV